MTREEAVSIRFATFDAFASWFRLWWGREPTAREVWLYLATRTSEAPAPTAQQQAEPGADELECNGSHDYGEIKDGAKECTVCTGEAGICEWTKFEAWLAAHPYPITWRERGAFFAGYRAAQSGQRAGVAEGWKLVPTEPTPEMLGQIKFLDDITDRAMTARYKAMLAAAPEAK